MDDKKLFELWDNMVEFGICTDEEIGVALHFGGRSIETLESLLFYRTGYRSWDQMMEEFEEE